MQLPVRFLLGFLCLVAFISGDESDRWKFEDRENFEQHYSLGAGSNRKKLLVDTTHGRIHVSARTGTDVLVKVTKTVRAESKEALAEGKRDVKLDISQQGNFLRLYMDAPWRTGEGGMNYRGDRYYGYTAVHDFDLQVPPDVDLVLRTVSRGDIQVNGTSGEYDVKSVNSGITLDDIAGYGNVSTINGSVKVSYRENPKQACIYKTLNGQVDVYFRPGLSADLRFKTFNGSAYTDFDVAPRPNPVQASRERRDGKFIYRAERSQTGRVGSGGPELQFESFNGSVRLHTALK